MQHALFSFVVMGGVGINVRVFKLNNTTRGSCAPLLLFSCCPRPPSSPAPAHPASKVHLDTARHVDPTRPPIMDSCSSSRTPSPGVHDPEPHGSVYSLSDQTIAHELEFVEEVRPNTYRAGTVSH
jgi:hypothetical protein